MVGIVIQFVLKLFSILLPTTTVFRSATVLEEEFLLLIAFFRTIHKFSIGLRSGLCAGQSNLVVAFLLIHDDTTLARWTGALSSGNIVENRLHHLSAIRGNKFFRNICRYFIPVTLPSTVISGPTPSKDIKPHT